MGDEQLANYGPWFDDERRLRSVAAMLEAFGLEVVEHDPRWDRCRQSPGRACAGPGAWVGSAGGKKSPGRSRREDSTGISPRLTQVS